jgi:GNAT superfamily N-acetyltransferase
MNVRSLIAASRASSAIRTLHGALHELCLAAITMRGDHQRRGAGVGADLLMSVVELARELGCAEIQWQTPHWNTAAARFYGRHGALDRQKLRFVPKVADQ